MSLHSGKGYLSAKKHRSRVCDCQPRTVFLESWSLKNRTYIFETTLKGNFRLRAGCSIINHIFHLKKNVSYMFRCHSPISSHPLPLPQSPKFRSIHLCLFCCLTYRIIITIILNSIYNVLVYCIGVFLSGLLHSV